MTYSDDIRWLACKLYYERFQSVRKTASHLLISKSSVSRWLNEHPVARKISRCSKRASDTVSWIVRSLQQNPFQSITTLQRALPDHLKVSRSTIARCVRRSGWTKKRTSKMILKSKNQDVLERNFINTMRPLEGSNWVSIDETCIWTDMVPRDGYALYGQRLVLSNGAKLQRSQRKKLSLLMAVSRSGQSFSFVKEGSIKSDDFAAFIERLPYPPGTTLVMDNASIHKTRTVAEKASMKRYTVVFTAPYRPDWNPIEHVFSPFKHHFRAMYSVNCSVDEKLRIVWANLPDTIYENCYKAVESRYRSAQDGST